MEDSRDAPTLQGAGVPSPAAGRADAAAQDPRPADPESDTGVARGPGTDDGAARAVRSSIRDGRGARRARRDPLKTPASGDGAVRAHPEESNARDDDGAAGAFLDRTPAGRRMVAATPAGGAASERDGAPVEGMPLAGGDDSTADGHGNGDAPEGDAHATEAGREFDDASIEDDASAEDGALRGPRAREAVPLEGERMTAPALEHPLASAASGLPGTDVQACPYLLGATGRWRAAHPDREHRCSAVRPAGTLSLEKQRRLCLVVGHRACPLYEQALDRRRLVLADAGLTPGAIASRRSRPYVRTAPLILDAGPAWRRATGAGSRSWSRGGPILLAILAVLAVLTVVAARLPGGTATPGSPPPAGSVAGAASAGATPTEAPSAETSPSIEAGTAPPATPQPTGPATAAPSGEAAASPSASLSTATHTYTVQRGDTLSAIAARFGTTVAAIEQLNHITNPRLIFAGQVLQLP